MGLMAEKGFCDMGDIACFISSISFFFGRDPSYPAQ